MRVLVIVVGVLVPAIASAEPCKPSGKLLFQLDHTDAGNATIAPSLTTRLAVDTAGAWTLRQTRAGAKSPTQKTGCLARRQLDTLKQLLAKQSWKQSFADVTCAGTSAESLTYRTATKLVLTRRWCDGIALSSADEQRLQRIHAILDPLWKPSR